LLESELFGYAPGAFSGAQRGGKPGLFELAAGGSVFLDEIGEMSTYLQAKLLRFLQDYSFRRVGGTKEITVKIRLISATHRDLEQMAQDNHFREDLFYRLNVLNIEIPPLRERADDIRLLVEHFVHRAATQIDQTKPTVTPAAMDKLRQFGWPGNIRQLENLLFRTIALLDGDVLDAMDIQLPKNKDNKGASPGINQNDQLPINIIDWQSAQQAFEAKLLNQLYPQYPSTRKLAARLKVSHNKIAMKLKQHGIE
jgi:TyrR family helix-turn-helix protein